MQCSKFFLLSIERKLFKQDKNYAKAGKLIYFLNLHQWDEILQTRQARNAARKQENTSTYKISNRA